MPRYFDVSKSSFPPPPDPGEPPDIISIWAEQVLDTWGLTKTEREVCELALKGLSDQEIAEATQSTYKTIKSHITQILKKSHCRNRVDIFAEILRL